MKGYVALSLAGRDKNRAYLIVAELDEGYVAIADGQLRKIDKPKRKKIKHLRILCEYEGDMPKTNKELKNMLVDYSQS